MVKAGSMNRIKIGGIMQSDGRALVKIMSVPDHVSVAGTVLRSMGENSINIELLVESFDLDDCGNFSLVIDQKDLDSALAVLDGIKPTIDRILSLDEKSVKEGVAYVASHRAKGKVVISVIK